MIGLQELKALNNRPAKVKDNFNRDSSCCQSSAGFVIHSGIHRSTAFVSAKDHPESHASLTYWKGQGQEALNAWIVQVVGGASVEAAEERACKAVRPDWKFRVTTAGGGRLITATRPDGGLTRSESATNWRWIHHRTQ